MTMNGGWCFWPYRTPGFSDKLAFLPLLFFGPQAEVGDRAHHNAGSAGPCWIHPPAPHSVAMSAIGWIEANFLMKLFPRRLLSTRSVDTVGFSPHEFNREPRKQDSGSGEGRPKLASAPDPICFALLACGLNPPLHCCIAHKAPCRP